MIVSPSIPRESEDARLAARTAGLRYAADTEPGIRRVRVGTGFAYRGADGKLVRDKATLARIRALAVPPAYTDVWICADERGHLQATGRDDRGRKQYRYHERWREVRDGVKFDRMIAFGEALPRLRRRVAADLRRPGLPREKVLAAAVAMLESTLVRVGNEAYRQSNDSYGLTTLRTRHVRISRGRARFRFKGKSGKEHEIEVDDPRLVKIVRRCLEIPGYELFQWVDDEGRRHSIDSGDVNDYIEVAAGADFTAKDFRTWAGTVLAARLLRASAPMESDRAARAEVARVIREVAAELRNTPAVCRQAYVHPAVVDAFISGMLQPLPEGKGWRSRAADEDALLGLLRDGAATVAAARPRKRRSRARAWRAKAA